jgi:hypothetical protein
MFTPRSSERRASSGLRCLGDDLREHVRLAQDQNVVGTELDLGPAVLRVDDLVALGDLHGHDLALVVARARADREDAAALRLLLRRIGQDDPARRRLLLLEGLDDQAVAQRLQIHSPTSCVERLCDRSWHSSVPSAR